MNDPLTLAFLAALLLGLERGACLLATRSAAGREWIRAHRLFHPNTISIVRVPMGLVSILVWTAAGPPFALLWFSFWMITDLTDGTIARHCDLATERGKWLDPLSDKCMVLPVLLFFALARGIRAAPPVPTVAVFILIDVFGQASRLWTTRSAASLFGKAKTAAATVLVAVVGLHQVGPLPGVGDLSVANFATATTVLAALSVLGKLLSQRLLHRVLAVAMFATTVLCVAVAVFARLPVLLAVAAGVLLLALLLPDGEDGDLPGWLDALTGGAFRRRALARLPKTLRAGAVVFAFVGISAASHRSAVLALVGGGVAGALLVAFLASTALPPGRYPPESTAGAANSSA